MKMTILSGNGWISLEQLGIFFIGKKNKEFYRTLKNKAYFAKKKNSENSFISHIKYYNWSIRTKYRKYELYWHWKKDSTTDV